MSQSEQFLTIDESAEIAGVTRETLVQYRDFGLLDAQDEGGTIRFRESDIRTLFYTKLKKQEQKAPPAAAEKPAQSTIPPLPKSETSRVRDEDPDANVEPPTLEQILAQHEAEQVAAASSLDTENSAPFPEAGQVEGVAAASDEQLVSSEHEKRISDDTDARIEAGEAEEVTSSLNDKIEVSSHVPARSTTSASPDLIEITKGLREQIEMLKDERTWLRERVEKLEARTERDQMLLLSENETVRSLLEPGRVSHSRFSFWRRALPFFGSHES
jgi:DNA-binding transcriptional MerR regulator